jgi:hypothetical protein
VPRQQVSQFRMSVTAPLPADLVGRPVGRVPTARRAEPVDLCDGMRRRDVRLK